MENERKTRIGNHCGNNGKDRFHGAGRQEIIFETGRTQNPVMVSNIISSMNAIKCGHARIPHEGVEHCGHENQHEKDENP